jgi:type I restriction enzyme, S subunit
MAKHYPSYKPSGVAWLGSMPSHWTFGRLKFSATSRTSNVDKHTKDDELPVELCNYVDVYNNDFITSELTFMKASATEPEIERFEIKKGDVLITKDSESWDDIAVPAMVAEDLGGVLCGYHLAIIRSLLGKFHAVPPLLL